MFAAPKEKRFSEREKQKEKFFEIMQQKVGNFN